MQICTCAGKGIYRMFVEKLQYQKIKNDLNNSQEGKGKINYNTSVLWDNMHLSKKKRTYSSIEDLQNILLN